MTRLRYELTNFEWSIVEPLLPNTPRGVPRVDDRKVLNGIFWRLRAGAPWVEIPERDGPPTTCYNRVVRWRQLGSGTGFRRDNSGLWRRPANDRQLLDPRPPARGER